MLLSSWRFDAPSIRALARTVGLTSFMPWKTLKNTMKKTRVTPRATFEVMPSPNHTAKIGARITRGIAFAALIYGSASAEGRDRGRRREQQADHKPEHAAHGEREQRLQQCYGKVRIDLAAGKPHPD